MRSVRTVIFVWIVGTHAGVCAAQDPAAAEQFFERRVRPLLVEHCQGCHGPKKSMSGLRLDSRAGLLKGGDNGPVVHPGAPEKSRLVQAIRHGGELKMPPKGKLKPEAVAALTEWVKLGAPWPESTPSSPSDASRDAWKRHWAFQPVRNPEPPVVKDQGWPKTSIDRFILARLEEKGLTPSAAAERRTLIRRATFDLIGLPPTPREVETFVADTSPDAFAQVVDRLLASPHYGERWGRYWLDVARYADTKGYVFLQESKYPWAWTYRDYVIRALNEDLPYDRFLLQQLAADRLPMEKDRHALTALGFLTVGGHFMNNPHDIIDDRIDVVARGLMALTVACARCHDHKFDPIPTQDYYSLYGVFASTVEPTVPPLFDDPPRTEAYRAFEKELGAREGKLKEFMRAKRAEVVASAKTRVAEYLLKARALNDQPSAENFMILADGKDLNPKMLERWQQYLERTRKAHHPVWAPWHGFASLPDKEFAEKARALAEQFLAEQDPAKPLNSLVVREFAENPPRTLAEAAQRYSDLLNGADKLWQEALLRAEQAGGLLPVRLPDPAQEELRQVFHGPETPPNVALNLVEDLDLLPDLPSQKKLEELRKAIEKWRASGDAAPPRAMVLEDTPAPHEPKVFLRGNPGNLGAAVPRRFLEVVAGPKRQPFRNGSGRLELAQAVVERTNPLTTRVIVNRVWLHHFGAGLVQTPGDFGMRSESPTHPDLLDHLATRFMDDGWSLKKLHRLILLSAVYQQKSADRADCQSLNPDNALLWRMNRRRLDFEALRDSLLAVSGRLDRTIGGPSMPDLVASTANRRTLYGFLDRLNVPGLFRTFDFPSPDTTSPVRSETTVPPQALFLMNNPFAIESARKLMERPEIAREKDEVRVDRLYRLLYGRPPTAAEVRLALAYVGNDSKNTAAWERYAQALLLTNEFVFVD